MMRNIKDLLVSYLSFWQLIGLHLRYEVSNSCEFKGGHSFGLKARKLAAS